MKFWKHCLLTVGLVLAAAASASAGNIVITGHDSDDHEADLFMNWALTYLLNNGNGNTIPATSTAKIGYIGNSSPDLGSYLGNYDNFQFYDLDNANWVNAFTDGNAVLVIGSGSDFVSNAGSAALNAQQAAFVSYFNAGGNIFVNTEQGLGAGFYGFIPSFGTTNSASLPGCSSESGNGNCMRPTAAGTTAGMTLAQIVNADITHTRFNNVASAFTVLSIYFNNGGAGSGDAITLGLVGGSAGGGGFQPVPGNPIPEPSTYALLGSGLVAMVLAARRKR